MPENDAKRSIVMPFTFTDAVKALRELLGLYGDVVGKIKEASEAIKQSKDKKAAKSLDALFFRNDGSRRYLENIAAGRGRREDLDAISDKMKETGKEYEENIDRLRSFRDFLRERYGMQVANKVDGLVYGGGGKASIRIDLMCMVDRMTFDDPLTGSEADRILTNIGLLNSKIEELHDLVLRLEKARNTD